MSPQYWVPSIGGTYYLRREAPSLYEFGMAMIKNVAGCILGATYIIIKMKNYDNISLKLRGYMIE